MNRVLSVLLVLVFASPALAAVPSKPGSLKVSAVSSSQLLVKWKNKSSSALGTKIFRSLSSSGSFELVGTAAAGASSFSDSSLNSATTYYYRLSAFNAEGDSSLTSAKKGKTKTATVVNAPNAPSNLRSNGSTTISTILYWTDNSSNETAFVIEYCPNSAQGPFARLASVAANTRSYAVDGLASDTTYYFRIRAENTAGSSNYSAVLSVHTLAPPNLWPVAVINAPARGNINEEVLLSAAGSSDPEGQLASVVWSFGDGSTAEGLEVRHAYSAIGRYLVTLKVTDSGGIEVSKTAYIRIVDPLNPQNIIPFALITAPGLVEAGQLANLSGVNSYDEDGFVNLYEWDMGDGTTKSGRDISHYYSAGGTYRVRLTVTDNDGGTASETALVVVPTYQMNAAAQATFDLINRERVAAGIAPLQVYRLCVASSQAHSEDMLARNFFAFDSPTELMGNRMRRWGFVCYVGEMILNTTSPEWAVRRWMGYAGTQAILLNPANISGAVGVAGNLYTMCFTNVPGN